MIKTNELKGRIVAKGLTRKEVATELGISEKTFNLKLKKGVFNSDQMFKMIELLNIENPSEIFFAKEVTQ